MVDFAKTFGSPTPSQSNTNGSDRPKSQFWLNVGMRAGEGDAERFVSLPQGVALDNLKPIAIRGSNEDYNKFTAARNDLLDQIMTLAASLDPGGEAYLSLEVQVRRVNDEVEAPAVDEASNAYAIKLV